MDHTRHGQGQSCCADGWRDGDAVQPGGKTDEGFVMEVLIVARTNRTAYRFDWIKGGQKIRTLSRSFNTLEEANHFADGKQVTDIYRHKGKYRVEWVKTVRI